MLSTSEVYLINQTSQMVNKILNSKSEQEVRRLIDEYGNTVTINTFITLVNMARETDCLAKMKFSITLEGDLDAE